MKWAADDGVKVRGDDGGLRRVHWRQDSRLKNAGERILQGRRVIFCSGCECEKLSVLLLYGDQIQDMAGNGRLELNWLRSLIVINKRAIFLIISNSMG